MTQKFQSSRVQSFMSKKPCGNQKDKCQKLTKPSSSLSGQQSQRKTFHMVPSDNANGR